MPIACVCCACRGLLTSDGTFQARNKNNGVGPLTISARILTSRKIRLRNNYPSIHWGTVFAIGASIQFISSHGHAWAPQCCMSGVAPVGIQYDWPNINTCRRL
eukprot:scaffold175_cov153-Cylindrotheca_fusiformis.AAC.3